MNGQGAGTDTKKRRGVSRAVKGSCWGLESLGVLSRTGLDPVTAAATVDDATRDADIVVTTTPADAPILHRVAPGTHVTAMGSDAEHKNEIAPGLIAAARYVADRLSQTRTLGELRHAGIDGDFPELGQILAGLAPGRTSDTQVTLADLTGTGIQDTAIATLALTRAARAGAGQDFTL